MQVKEIKPINFLFFRTKTRVSELGRYVGIVARELYRDAIINDLEIAGPVYWNYIGFAGNEREEFTLEIALPITEVPPRYEGKFRIKREDVFHCVSLIHEGSWFDLPESYDRLKQFIDAHRLKLIAINREVYINMDFNNPEANVTEIQIGITEDSVATRKMPVIADQVVN